MNQRQEGAIGRRIAHIGIAVESLEQALKLYRDGLGIEMTHSELVADQGVKVAFLPLGDSEIELLEPLGSESTVARFIERRGEGIHHLCIEVEDIQASLQQLAAQDVQLIDESPRIGAEGKLVAFVHPKSANGVLIELMQKG